MLKDRLALVEYEMNKLRSECAKTYLELIRDHPNPSLEDKLRYEEMQVRLNSLFNDETLIKKMLSTGLHE